MKRKTKKPGPAFAQSRFLEALREEFFDDHEMPTWPPAEDPEVRTAQARRQMPAALRAMILAVEAKEAPEGAGGPGTALGKVKQAAADTRWPKGSRVPPQWKKMKGLYRRFEVAWAINIMMEALARSGGGSGPKQWPGGG